MPAVEKGAVDPSSLEPHDPHMAALSLRNGLMPDQAGSVLLPGGQIGAYDLTSLQVEGSRLVIGPSDKSAVKKEERDIVAPGALTLSSPNGLVKVIGVVELSERAHWGSAFKRAGCVALRMFGIESPGYEIDDIDSNTHVVTAKPVLPVYSFPGLRTNR